MTEQEHQQQQTITRFTCPYCLQTDYKSGYFTIPKEGEIQFFCSKECAEYERKRNQVFICAQCGKSFENLTASHKRKYCSRPCKLSAYYSRYKKFNWCSMCNEWIKKEDSIFKPAGTIIYHGRIKYRTKKDNHFCPICKNRLRVRNWYRKKKDNGNNTTTTEAI